MKKKNHRFTNMKAGYLKLFFGAAILILLASCSKGGTATPEGGGGGGIHDPSPTDTTAPVLVISTPTSNQVFTNGNTINVTGSITDDYGLYLGSIRITDDANGSLLKEQLYEIHYVLAYNFNISYLANVSASSNYTVTVSFQDHGLNVTTKSVKIKVNP